MPANSRDLKRRIGSVKNTQKITNAMKLVAAAKFARAQAAVKSAKPYNKALEAVGAQVMSALKDVEMKLSEKSKIQKKIAVAVIASDRGLCGGLNTNLFKELERFKKANEGVTIEVIAYGKKAVSYCKNRFPIISKILGRSDKPSFEDAKEMVKQFKELFLASGENTEKYDEIYVLYPEFQSALAQIPTAKRIFPLVSNDENKQDEEAANEETNSDFIIEPNAKELAEGLIERKIATQVFQALLESKASEQGSRMSAMDSATRNAGDVIKKLTLQYNRARQASITKELIEIVSGAEAL